MSGIIAKTYRWLSERESYVFLIVALANSIPIFLYKYFPSIDGPAHLYNARIIKELFLNPDGYLAGFHQFNTLLVPNWIGHALMALGGLLFPWSIAEKLVLLIYVLGLPYGFRKLEKQLSNKKPWMAYFSFPFVYSILFLAGFYNFCLGLTILLFSVAYCQKTLSGRISLQNFVIIAVLALVLYFSHLFIYASFILILLFWIGVRIALNFNSSAWGKKITGTLLISGSLLLAIAPSSLLAYKYYLSLPADRQVSFLSKSELIEDILNLRSLVVYSKSMEYVYTRLIVLAVLSLIIWIIISKLSNKQRGVFKRTWAEEYKSQLLFNWLGLLVAMVLLYFYLPNSDGLSGFISVRINLFIWLIILLVLSVVRVHYIHKVVLICIVVFSGFKLNDYYAKMTRSIYAHAEDHLKLTNGMKDKSALLVVGNTADWLKVHSSNYMGLENELHLLYNYELSLNYFPLSYDMENFPNYLLGKYTSPELDCLSWPSNSNGRDEVIAYVIEVKDGLTEDNPCHEIILQILREYYSLEAENETCKLWTFKKN